MKILIAGHGFVGKAVANALQKKHEVVIIDPKYTTEQIKDHIDADGIIVCVDTPTTEEGVCDVGNIANVLDQVPVFMPVLIKSTVTPGTVDGLNKLYPNHSVVYSPEFLRAVSANEDFLNQKFIIIGGDDPESFWQELLKSVIDCKLFFYCSPVEALMVKYSINSFLASKVAFFNQIFDLCDKNGADYSIVRQIMSHDARIGNSHSLVPGLDGNRGFGGHCFPKDTQAFLHYATQLESPLSILDKVVEYNNKIRKNT